MPNVTVEPAVSSRQQKQFLNFPWQLYRDDPHWIPPLRFEQRELAGYRPHPFYEQNRVQTFLAYRGGEVCGRIAAILNHVHNEYRHERLGFWGFFECIDDQEVATALFDAVKQWFAAQDIHALRGPTNPGMNYTWGLLVEGFDASPMFLMTYNPPYYARLVEGCGFRKSQDLYAYWSHVGMLPASTAKHGPIAEQIVERFDIKVRTLDRTRFQAEVEEFLAVYNCSMANHWNFAPMSAGEVRHMAKGLRHLLVPELAVVAEIDGRMVAAALGLLDFNPTIKRIDGRLFPFGFLRLLSSKRKIKNMRIMAANVLPEYQLQGVGLVVLRAMVPKGLECGIQEAEFSWVAESNRLSRGSLEKGGAKRTKTYRIYDLA